jgi:hypothetical protein
MNSSFFDITKQRCNTVTPIAVQRVWDKKGAGNKTNTQRTQTIVKQSLSNISISNGQTQILI